MLGYPMLSMRSIPKDPEWLHRFFESDIKAGRIEGPLEVQDVWPENYSANSVQKVWAAKFAARHPNVVVLNLSSFKCGHDAPTYGLIDSIISASATPYSALHDIDANKPGGSIKIRVKTYAHSLKLHEERLEDTAKRTDELKARWQCSLICRADRGQENVVGGVAGDKFVHQRGSNVGVQARHKARARPDEIRVNIGEAGAIAPQRVGGDGLPGIVDIAERHAFVAGDVVIDAHQLLAPGGGQRDDLCEAGKPLLVVLAFGMRFRSA